MTGDSEAAKQEQREIWRSSAAAWKRNDDRIQQTAAPVTQRMLERAGIATGHRVLDIASGTGEPALPAAQLVGPSGNVLLTDITREMLDIARQKARDQGIDNVEFRIVDGEAPDAGENEFDAALCRFGVMFMPRPAKCLAAVYRALVPGGRTAFATWTAPQRNPFLTLAMPILAKHAKVSPPDPDAPGPFALADPAKLARLFEDAGFSGVDVEEVDVISEYESGHEYYEFTSEGAGPIGKMIRELPDDVKEEVRMEIAAAASGGNPDDPVKLPGVALVGSGAK